MMPPKNAGLLLFVLLCSSISCRPDNPQQQGSPELSLRLHCCKPLQKEIVFQLTVSNSGPVVVTIPHLREGELERNYAWMGFSFLIQDENEQGKIFIIRQTSREVWPLFGTDVIELTPGQSFSLFINMADAMAVKPGVTQNFKRTILAETSGSYTARACLCLVRESIPILLHHRREMWCGRRESNPVDFVISNTVENAR